MTGILLIVNFIFSTPADSIFTDSLKEEVVVSAIRANALTPVTQYNLKKAEIREKYFGYDIPFLLQASPSIVTTSDAGNFIGYSEFRLRGMDSKRISFNINGIPVNDAETQGFYTNNFADLASSAQSIQIQRGIGTTANGTAPIAGSVNLLTTDLQGPAGFNLFTGYGSYATSRVTAEYNTGRLNNNLAFYGRISSIQSNGYRRNASANLKTYFLSGAYFGKRSILKFNAFGGITQTQLAFYPLDKATFKADPRTNFNLPFEKDQFQQNFFQGQYTYNINSKLNFSTSAYYVHGNAPYYQLIWPGFGYQYANMPNIISGTDTVTSTTMLPSYRLNQDFLGAMAFLNYTSDKFNINLGIHANHFKSDHFMEINWAQQLPAGIDPYHQAYFNTGYKSEQSAFIKASLNATEKLIFFGDFQVRRASWKYRAEDKPIFRDTNKIEDMSWIFINPKAGLRYAFNNNISIYASGGFTQREPTRTDYLLDDRANFDVQKSLVKPESVIDIEAGTNITTEKLRLDANIYLMEFNNEIMATGELNAYGASIRKNVTGGSYRRGLEITASYKVLPFLTLINNSAFSINRIKRFDQTYTVFDETDQQLFNTDGSPVTKTVTYTNVSPLLTPQVILNQGIRFDLTKWFNFDITGRYVGKAYLENTNNEEATIPAYFIADFRAALNLSKWIKAGNPVLSFNLNNFTNTSYAPSGAARAKIVRDGTGNDTVVSSPGYYPAARINFFVTLNLKF